MLIMRSPQETSRSLERYRDASHLKKLGARILGRYPGWHEREVLRRSELTPTQRIRENIARSVYDTAGAKAISRRLNRIVDPRDKTKKLKISSGVPIARTSLKLDTIVKMGGSLANLRNTDTASIVVCLQLPRDGSAPGELGGLVYGNDGFAHYDSIDLSEDAFNTLPAVQQQQVSDTVALITFNCSLAAFINPLR